MKSSGQKAASTAGLSATRFKALPSSLGFFSARSHGAAPARAGRPRPSCTHPHLFEHADNFLLLPQASRAQSMFRKPRTGFRSTASPDVLLLTHPFGLETCSRVLTAVTPRKSQRNPFGERMCTHTVLACPQEAPYRGSPRAGAKPRGWWVPGGCRQHGAHQDPPAPGCGRGFRLWLPSRHRTAR